MSELRRTHDRLVTSVEELLTAADEVDRVLLTRPEMWRHASTAIDLKTAADRTREVLAATRLAEDDQ